MSRADYDHEAAWAVMRAAGCQPTEGLVPEVIAAAVGEQRLVDPTAIVIERDEAHEIAKTRLHEVHQEAYEEFAIDCDYLAFEVVRALASSQGVEPQ